MRRLTLKKTPKALAISKTQTKNRTPMSSTKAEGSPCAAASCSNHATEVDEGGGSSVEGTDDATVCSKTRLRDVSSWAKDFPGAKRARAAAWISGFVERHYAELRMPWPIKPPPKASVEIQEKHQTFLDQQLFDGGCVSNEGHDDGADDEDKTGDRKGNKMSRGSGQGATLPPSFAIPGSTTELLDLESVAENADDVHPPPSRVVSVRVNISSEGDTGASGKHGSGGDNLSPFAMMLRNGDQNPYSDLQQTEQQKKKEQQQAQSGASVTVSSSWIKLPQYSSLGLTPYPTLHPVIDMNSYLSSPSSSPLPINAAHMAHTPRMPVWSGGACSQIVASRYRVQGVNIQQDQLQSPVGVSTPAASAVAPTAMPSDNEASNAPTPGMA